MRKRPYIYINLLHNDGRYFGILNDYYEGPIYGFGFWYFHIYWVSGFWKF